jgi:hypothetical protein
MDTQSAIRYAVWYRLTQDEQLKQLFGGQVPLHLVWAPKDAPLPYMVHRFQNNRVDTIIKDGRWYLDFWDYNDTAERIYTISGRAIELMEHAVLGLVDSGAGYLWVCQVIQKAPRNLLVAARFYLQSDGDVPEDTDGIWHYASTWNVRFTLSPTQIERLINAEE